LKRFTAKNHTKSSFAQKTPGKSISRGYRSL
jgi:hypothetical protein